ncbi:hypothetical protein [Moorella sp. ACPs]|uniref:hypothetical protein n=1 Tax=Neomoorella carbonis TaxID=3062783 RepID=UPI003873BB1A
MRHILQQNGYDPDYYLLWDTQSDGDSPRAGPGAPAGRRPGDPPVLVADAKKIRVRLGWVPVHDDLEGIIYSAWQWERKRNSVPAGPATISPRR